MCLTGKTLYSADLKALIMKMMTPNTGERPDIVDVMCLMGHWDRIDRITVRAADYWYAILVTYWLDGCI